MLFNSLVFVVFFASVLALYWTLPGRWRKALLLVASYVFYASWDWRFLSLIVLSTVVDYVVALAIHATVAPKRRRRLLLISIGTNLGVLGFFKYFNFFLDSLSPLLAQIGLAGQYTTLEIILPVGISFYTFQTMSYTIDVYRGNTTPTRDVIGFATFVAFFPQLVAGPIERFASLFPQLERPAPPRIDFFRKGAFLLLQGYVKKVAIADSIAPVVNAVFANPAGHDAGQLLEAAILFTAQIYCDFSGYSDIARGAAYLLGVELVVNFRAPLFSRSITEFWRRWHVSLSSWLRDYVYIPLGGNRRGRERTYVNLMLTMLLGGLWHGAHWKFVVWGGLHGGLLALERAIGLGTADVPPRASARFALPSIARALICFAAVVALFVIFRADSVAAAVEVFGRIATGPGLASVVTLRLGAVLAAILMLDAAVYYTDRHDWILDRALVFRVLVYATLLLSIILFSGHQQQSFIYFAF